MKFKRKEKSKVMSKGMWMVIFIAVIMVLSSIGFIYDQSGGSKMTYNGYKFKQAGNKWAVKISDQYQYFDYYPGELVFLNVTGLKEKILASPNITITFDSETQDLSYIDLARFELANHLIKTKIVLNAVANESKAYQLPVVTCNNATNDNVVIYFKRGPDLSITIDNDCVIAEGKGIDFIMLKDRIAYAYYGIMD